jgi:prolyl-tRNA editing enzyme YbaK/EbsC (Cys-tRNA(Pro) deacylase)
LGPIEPGRDRADGDADVVPLDVRFRRLAPAQEGVSSERDDGQTLLGHGRRCSVRRDDPRRRTRDHAQADRHGAGGRDFHNFNVAFRDDPGTEVVAFTAAQIPGIAGRAYPPSLAGHRYPGGIPIHPEDELADLIRRESVDEVVFACSDVSYEHVMSRAAIALAAGADFTLLGPGATMLASRKPVIAVCAVRTGVGKSQTSRYLGHVLLAAGLKVALVRHPMPYHDLEAMRVQRFETIDDIDASHELIEHEPTMSAVAEANAMQRPQSQVAKTVVLQDRSAYVLAILPASERLDLHKLRDLLGASKSLRLATEEEMARDFPMLEVGAVPPIGPMLPSAEVVDQRLLEQERILCAGGDHRHSIVLDPRDVVRIADAKVADICTD